MTGRLCSPVRRDGLWITPGSPSPSKFKTEASERSFAANPRPTPLSVFAQRPRRGSNDPRRFRSPPRRNRHATAIWIPGNGRRYVDRHAVGEQDTTTVGDRRRESEYTRTVSGLARKRGRSLAKCRLVEPLARPTFARKSFTRRGTRWRDFPPPCLRGGLGWVYLARNIPTPPNSPARRGRHEKLRNVLRDSHARRRMERPPGIWNGSTRFLGRGRATRTSRASSSVTRLRRCSACANVPDLSTWRQQSEHGSRRLQSKTPVVEHDTCALGYQTKCPTSAHPWNTISAFDDGAKP